MDTPGLADRILGYLPLLAKGAGVTIGVSAFSIFLGFVVGALLLAASLRYGRAGVHLTPVQKFNGWAVSVYVSFFRGTPLLVQLLMLFYLPTAFGINLPPLPAAIIAMGLNSAAFQCEILRAGLSAVPNGQLDASLSFGLSRRDTFRFIQLPQITRAVWPAVISEAIDVLKSSAVISVIAVAELTRAGRQIVASNYRPLEVYLTMGAFYLVITGAIFVLGTWMGIWMLSDSKSNRRVRRSLASRRT